MINQLESNPATTPALPFGTGTSSANGAGARQRIHRVAGMLHKAIDSAEQTLGSKGADVSSRQAQVGQQARVYGDQMREKIDAQPLQSAAIALGTGVVLGKLFMRAPQPQPQVRVVKVPVPVRVPVQTHAAWTAGPSPERRVQRWMQAAGNHVQALGRSGQYAAGRVGSAAGSAAGTGVAGTKALASTVASAASTLPLQMRLATERLLARSQVYGSIARSNVQAHPLWGAGALLGVGALLATPWLRSHRATTAPAYVTVDEKGNGVAWQHGRPGLQSRTVALVQDRPVASAAVLIGIGALVGAAMLRRR